MSESVAIESLYGIVVVLDPGNDEVEVPATGNEISKTDSCVAVPVRPYVDGSVRLWLGPLSDAPEAVVVFNGTVNTPTGVLAIETPEQEESISIEVEGTPNPIRISVDDPASPSRVWVAVAAPR